MFYRRADNGPAWVCKPIGLSGCITCDKRDGADAGGDYSTRRALTRVAWDGSAICAGLALVLLVLILKKARGNGARTPAFES